jgi:hypothetical protein
MYVALPLTTTTFIKRKKIKKTHSKNRNFEQQQNADAHHLENK